MSFSSYKKTIEEGDTVILYFVSANRATPLKALLIFSEQRGGFFC